MLSLQPTYPALFPLLVLQQNRMPLCLYKPLASLLSAFYSISALCSRSPFCRERNESPEKASDSSRALQLVHSHDTTYSARLPAWKATWVDGAVKISLMLCLGWKALYFLPIFRQTPAPAMGAARGSGSSILDVCGARRQERILWGEKVLLCAFYLQKEEWEL